MPLDDETACTEIESHKDRVDSILNGRNTTYSRSVAGFSGSGPLVGRITVSRLFHLAVLLVTCRLIHQRKPLEFLRARKFDVVFGCAVTFIDRIRSPKPSALRPHEMERKNGTPSGSVANRWLV